MEALLRREEPERKYRHAILSDIKQGDVLIRSGEGCELLSVIDQPTGKDRTIYVFKGFSVRRGMMRHIFENETRDGYPNVYVLKK